MIEMRKTVTSSKTGSVGRRCSCRDPKTGKNLGQRCPKLTKKNTDHGQWFWRLELPTSDGERRVRRRSGFTNPNDAQDELDHAVALLGLPERGDTETLARIGDAIVHAIAHREALPTIEELRRRLHTGATLGPLPTVGEWLRQWLPTKRALAKNTVTSYESHIRLYLTPYLGHHRLDRLTVDHVAGMFESIEEFNDLIRTARASKDPKLRAKVRYRRTVGPASQQRIRATLRTALNAAQRLITYNPAQHVELPSGKSPKPRPWTPERVARWQATGEIPSRVMVWTAEQTGRFLDHAIHDPLYPLYHLIAFRGLRRGEACGLHWSDTHLNEGTIDIRWQLVLDGWAPKLEDPKTEDSDATVALDTETITVLRAHQAQQDRQCKALGQAWPDTDLVFTEPDGQPLHPAEVSDHFRQLSEQAGLPPIRLHDLRHGAATIALTAGVDLKVVQATLRHSRLSTTADTYTTVLPELSRAAADQTASIVPRHTRLVAPDAVEGQLVSTGTATPRSETALLPPTAAQGRVVTVIDHNEGETA